QDRMRGCESCHSIDATHEWLPYQERHVEAMSCETCHIPAMYSNASQQIDWTVVEQDGSAETICRGVEDQGGSFETLITGFQPVLLPTEDLDGNLRLMPHNLSTAWFWVHGDPDRPVRQEDLVEAWLDGENYHPEIVALFDNDGDQNLDSSELIIDSPEKESLIAGRLAAIGLENPRIVGEIQPYSINHDVATGDWAIKDCSACHSQDSLITVPFKLASYVPGGVIPDFVKDAQPVISGDLVVNDDGELWYEPQPDSEGYYILGLSNVSWIDLLGSLIFLSTLVVIAVHASYRLITSLRNPKEDDEVSRVYMYSIYERLWHWLQTFTIVTLIFTGLIIHKPDTFGIFDFRGVVLVHNVLAVILLINAGLSLFYHLASGEIQQYLPRPRGFFDMAISQAIYYVRGIFKNEPHPFEKTSEKKLNPLQQVTYFGILNVLLPLQGITGILMWGAQRWPELTESLGGLPFLAPFHTLIAWLFATFVVFHVYLTTTGYKPWTSINAMINGWDEIEVHHESREDSNP
ncbi:MAG: cytochrome b/b6 domain-containing protein, partial [Anaerolineales bacterium]